MMYKFILMTTMVITGMSFGYTQEKKPVKIGERSPDFYFRNIHNYPKGSEVKLSDFKGKLVILDFWATTCGSCIASFPKMEALQETFKNDIQIILINSHESDDAVKQRMKKIKKTLPNLPYVNGDSTFRQYFPYIFVPHHVWIDGEGIVRAITNGVNASLTNVSDALKKGEYNFNYKEDIARDVWQNGLLNTVDSLFEPALKMYSSVFSYIPNLGGGVSNFRDKNRKFNKRLYYNMPMVTLYQEAFRNEVNVNDPRMIIWEIPGKQRFEYPADTVTRKQWMIDNLFSYEIKFGEDQMDKTKTFMQQDINRFFSVHEGVKGVVEKRKIKTMALSIPGKIKAGDTGLRPSFKITDSSMVVVNYDSENWVAQLNANYNDHNLPFILNDGPENISFEINGEIDTLEGLLYHFKKLGFKIRKKKTEVPMLVFKKAQ